MTNLAQAGLRVFVSHKSENSDFSVRLVQDLRRALGGEDAVWYDSQGGLFGGDYWWDTIVKELTARPIFIVVLSPEALASKWVQSEVRIAWKQKNSPAGKHLIPIHYRKCDVPEDLDTLQVISFLPPEAYENAFQSLLKALDHITKLSPKSSPTVEFDFEKFLRGDFEKTGMSLPLPPGRSLSSPVVQKTKEQWLAEGNELYEQNRYQDALVAFEQAIRFDPNLAFAHCGKANCLYGMKNLSTALTSYERAIQLDPSLDKAYLGKGSILRDLQRYPEALAAFDQFIHLTPNYVGVYVEKGDILMRMLRPREALDAYQQALRIDPNYYPAIIGKNMALQAININPFSGQFF